MENNASITIQLDKHQASFVVRAVDEYLKIHGLNAAGQAMAIAAKIQAAVDAAKPKESE